MPYLNLAEPGLQKVSIFGQFFVDVSNTLVIVAGKPTFLVAVDFLLQEVFLYQPRSTWYWLKLDWCFSLKKFTMSLSVRFSVIINIIHDNKMSIISRSMPNPVLCAGSQDPHTRTQ